ncbi:MAG: SDR family oxidoreductase [Saprospiraceae bacterium]|nr:SDR family oxidoreductase [Saprospiraceae bacterium]
MKILITGAHGFLGQKLVNAVLAAFPEATKVVCLDLQFSGSSPHPKIEQISGDLGTPETIARIRALSPDLIFHLAAIVSGEAEKDFALGRRVNLHATEQLLEICRTNGNAPLFVFASSCAVFGGDFGDIVTDHTRTTPQSSYGTQKALGELLVNDYSRRGFVDGRSLRLPTICIRPGTANAATTSFVSGIIREPLAGRVQNCPVDPSTKVWILSPNQVILHFLHAAQIPQNLLGDNRLINLPGITVTIGEMTDALQRAAGQKTMQYITWEQDPFLQSIVLTFPHTFITKRAHQLGFTANNNFEEILNEYLLEINYNAVS